MQLSIADVLEPSDVAAIVAALAGHAFVDGRATAGWAAAGVKRNLQAADDARLDLLRETVTARLLAHPLFVMAARPRSITRLLFSRYEPGHAYGAHVDAAVMDGQRVDVAFTLFLSDPATYTGGALVLHTSAGEQSIKPPAGCAVVYPATTLHEVEPVTAGVRLAAVGWVRSQVRDAARRELLFDLDTAQRRLFAAQGAGPEVDLVAKSLANLQRMWVED